MKRASIEQKPKNKTKQNRSRTSIVMVFEILVIIKDGILEDGKIG